MLRFVFLLPAFVALGGCVTTSSGTDAVREDSQSTVLLHTSLHEGGCAGIELILARRDDSGRWVYSKRFYLKTLFDQTPGPSRITLPPGEYGIAELECALRKTRFSARVAQSGFAPIGRQHIYEKPIATFNVLPSEVVDIGSLRLPSGWGTDRYGWKRQVFVGVVTSMPEAMLRTLAETQPELYRRRVARPMKSAINI